MAQGCVENSTSRRAIRKYSSTTSAFQTLLCTKRRSSRHCTKRNVEYQESIMSSGSPDSSLSHSRLSSKSNFRPCSTCPSRLSDFWRHESTPESESESAKFRTNKVAVENLRVGESESLDRQNTANPFSNTLAHLETGNRQNVADNSDVSSIKVLDRTIAQHSDFASYDLFSNVSTEVKASSSSSPSSACTSSQAKKPQVCPDNCSCPSLATQIAGHAQTPEARSYLDTKEGQDHIKICIPSCPYKKLQAEREGKVVKDAGLLRQHRV